MKLSYRFKLTAVLWLLRPLRAPEMRRYLESHSLAFATWYALTAEFLVLSKRLPEIKAGCRQKKTSLAASIELLKNLGYDPNLVDPSRVELLLTGLDLHARWFLPDADRFDADIAEVMAALRPLATSVPGTEAASRVELLAASLDLTPVESAMLDLSVLIALAPEESRFFSHCLRAFSADTSRFWTVVLDCAKTDLVRALREDGPLQAAGLLSSEVHAGAKELPALSLAWQGALADDKEDLLSTLVKPWEHSPGFGLPARLSEDDEALAVRLLRRGAQRAGVNLMLYGAATNDKSAAVSRLLAQAGLKGWALRSNLQVPAPAALYAAGRLLSGSEPASALVVTRPRDALQAGRTDFLYRLFGLHPDTAEDMPQDRVLLEHNGVPGIWLENDLGSLPSQLAHRYLLHLPLLKARRQDRATQLSAELDALRADEVLRSKILGMEGASAMQVRNAHGVAQLLTADADSQQEVLLQVLGRSVQALHKESLGRRETVLQYDPSLINCSGRFGPLGILKALRNRPKGSLCLYGPPGTGKTQYVEYLAQELDIPLTSKRASDIFSKWVGDSEKNISAVFEEAADSESILFLDEGDSFLRNRTLAQHSWEITAVNELLQQMERFSGIFILATNLQRSLDAAALRRFTFKLEFLPLTAEQRWALFLRENRLETSRLDPNQALQWQEALMFLPGLSAGDFATVKRQCVLLGESLTPEDWLVQLKLECDARASVDTASAQSARP